MSCDCPVHSWSMIKENYYKSPQLEKKEWWKKEVEWAYQLRKHIQVDVLSGIKSCTSGKVQTKGL